MHLVSLEDVLIVLTSILNLVSEIASMTSLTSDAAARFWCISDVGWLVSGSSLSFVGWETIGGVMVFGKGVIHKRMPHQNGIFEV